LDENLLAITLLVTIGFQLSCFFIAYTCQFDKITDLAGTSNFLLVAVMTLLISQTYFSRQIVVTALVCVWALRLGGFLLYRVIRRENDARFDEFRANFFKFLGFWIFQILWVWIVSLAVIFLNAASEDVSLNAGDYIGWTIWLIGFLLSSIADFSKDAFSSRMHKSSPFIRDGVWSISRHPNYAGKSFLSQEMSEVSVRRNLVLDWNLCLRCSSVSFQRTCWLCFDSLSRMDFCHPNVCFWNQSCRREIQSQVW